MKLQLRPPAYIENRTGTYSIITEKKIFTLKNENRSVQQVLDDLSKKKTIHHEEYMDDIDAVDFIDRLKDLNLITTHNEYQEQTPHARQLGYLAAYADNAVNAQEEIQKAKIAVFGLGGIGTELLNHLVGAGVLNFTIIDFDKVEIHNLNRQYLYSTKDVGKQKVDVAKKRILERNAELQINIINSRVDSKQKASDIIDSIKPNFAAICLDTPLGTGPQNVANAAWDLKVPSCSAGVGIKKGFYGPIYHPSKSHQRPPRKYGGEGWGQPRTTSHSFGPTNSIISAMMAKEIIHDLCGIATNESYQAKSVFDFETMVRTPNYLSDDF